MKKTVAIILSGCGNKDGAEIQESVLAILAVAKAGAVPLFFAPDMPQARSLNFLTDQELPEKRNVLCEAARIARSKIEELGRLNAGTADALIIPGGQGATRNLSDFAQMGAACTVHPEVERVVREYHNAKKPIGFICIAPVIAARVLGPEQVELTIGSDPETSGKLEEMGARHINTRPDEIHVDRRNRVISTCAYMLAKDITQVEAGITKLVNEVLEMA